MFLELVIGRFAEIAFIQILVPDHGAVVEGVDLLLAF
jgi:hypothetical protein